MDNTFSKQAIVVAMFSCVLGFIGLFGSDLYLPAMPAMQQAFNTSVAYIEWSVAIYMIGCGISPLLFGPLSDSFGRKPVVLVGLVIATVGAVIALLSKDISTFLAARIIQGFGAGAAYSMFRVMIRDVVSGKQMARLASYTTMIFNLSPVLGLVVGGYLVHYFHWQACFIVLVASYILLIIVYGLFCPETVTTREQLIFSDITKHYRAIMQNHYLVGMAICSGFAFAVIFAFATAGAFIFQSQLHLSAVVFGWLGAFLSAASIAGKFLNANLTKRFGLMRLMTVGMIGVILAGFGLLLLPHTVAWVLACIIVATAATALILSNAMSCAMQVYQQKIGYAASMYGSIQLITVFISNTILAHLYHFGIISLSGFYMIVALLSIIILISISRTKHESKASEPFSR